MSAYNIAAAYRALRDDKNVELALAHLRVFYPAPVREEASSEDQIAEYIRERFEAETMLGTVLGTRGAQPIFIG